MIGLSVQGAGAVAADLKRASASISDAALEGVRHGTVLLDKALRDELSQPAVEDAFWGRLGARGDGLSVRTGATRRSIAGGGSAYRVGGLVTGAVGSGSESLKRHELGGTFSGTSPAGFARIPTANAMTPGGDERAEFKGKSLRGVPGVFLHRTLGGKLWAMRQVGKRGPVELLYLLVKSYTLRPRHIFQRVRDEQAPKINAAMGQEVSVALKGAGL